MTKRIHQEYHKRSTNEVAAFANNLRENVVVDGTFDSAAAIDYASTVINQSSEVTVPENIQVILDEVSNTQDENVKNANRSIIISAVLDGINVYEDQHGVEAPGDVIEHALHMGYSKTHHAIEMYKLDSANSMHHDQLSLQPNRATVAILSAMMEAIPFAHYMPADISSNEGKLAIVTHQAGSAYGMYAQNGSLDGVNSGNPYITSSRLHAMTPAVTTGDIDGKLTTVQTTDDTCDQGAAPLKLLRGRSVLYVQGKIAAREVSSSGSGNSTLSGSVTLSGTTYQIGGTINTDTGEFALTTTPALPDTVPVTVEGFIDYERAPELTPSILTAAETFQLFAKPWRVFTQQTPDSRSQLTNELGLDPYSESLIAIQNQQANERHYQVLTKARHIAVNNTTSFDFDWSNRKGFMNRSDAWRDFGTPLGAVSQQMAIDTFDHGVTHLYVGKHIAADLKGLPNDIFVPSGLPERPGIYRIGRLFGTYDVYYTPKGLVDTPSAGQILAIGRATNVSLNPFVLGDAVAPYIIALGIGTDLKQGAGYYARNFTEVNPHEPSSMGCAMIEVTNLQ